MKAYLIINDTDQFAHFKDKYIVIKDRAKALGKLKALGWGKQLIDFGVSDTIGTMSFQAEGDKKLSFLPIEIEE